MKKSISGGLCALSALTAVGSTLIFFPFKFKDGADIISLLISFLIAFLLTMFFYPMTTGFFGAEKFHYKRAFEFVKIPIFMFFEAALLLFAVSTLCDFTSFTSDVILPNVPKWLIFLALGLVTVILASGHFSALSKTAILSFFAVAVLTAVIFIFSIPDMDLKYIKPRDGFNVAEILKNTLCITLMTFAESFVALSVIGERASEKRSVLVGNLVGGGIILISVLNALLVFGGEFSAELRYPYISAVRTVGEKDVFSGLEGFLYLTVFLCCVIKISLSLFGVKLLANKIQDIKNF